MKKIWRVTYIPWYSVVRQHQYCQADSKEEVYRNFEYTFGFGYEEIDIYDIEEVTWEEAVKSLIPVLKEVKNKQ